MLPKKDKEGVPYISYSQANLWSDVKGYNTGMDGKIEYMLSYFYKVNFPDVGFGGFGGKVGTALEVGDFSAFSPLEIETLKKVERLDVFEKEIRIPFDGFYLVGYIDTCTEDLKYIKDYKTASPSSKEKYYTDDYKQLMIYAKGVHCEKGYYPERMNVEIIERKGNAFNGGIDALSLGDNIWIVEKEISAEKIEEVAKYVEKTALEISEYWSVWKKINKIQ
jgi:hypothetical protein